MPHPHDPACPCCRPFDAAQRRGASRRGFLTLATVGAGAALLAPAWTRPAAAAGNAEALLLTCMDYRLTWATAMYMDQRGLRNQYDHLVLAGASLGVVMDPHPDWTSGFWEHFAVAEKLHRIRRVILMDHRDCGAYATFLGQDFAKDPALETKIHTENLQKLGQQVRDKYPKHSVELLLMALDGTVEPIPLTG